VLRALAAAMIVACAAAVIPALSQTIPTEYAPIQIGKGLAKDFANRSVQGKNVVIYPEICAWYGSLIYAREAHDKQLLGALQRRFEDLLAFNNQARVPNARHVDFDVFGVVPLELYMQTGEMRYLEMGLRFADLQWESPQADGLSSETRYWIDDMYMLTLLQLEAYRATKDAKYLLRGAMEMAAYIRKLQQPNGLFFHSPDAKYFWGRGHGWVAARMTEMLTSLPKDNPNYSVILAGYKKMMSALLTFQSRDGVWRQLLDKEESWAESSSSGMFTFAFAEGIRNGWLAKDLYTPAVYRAWTGVSGLVDQNSLVTSVCEGTNKEDSLTYYLLRKRRTGDLHGQAAVLWAATAMARLESSSNPVAAKR